MARVSQYLFAVSIIFFSAFSLTAHAQNLEGLLRGIASDVVRAAVQQTQPIGPLNATQARQAVVDLGMATNGDAGARTVQAPINGYWLTGTPARADLAPILVSHDGRYVMQLAGHNSVILERLPGGRTRQLTQEEGRELMIGMLAGLRPEALVAFGRGSHAAPIIISAPNCPACIELDRIMRPMRDVDVRLVPTMIGREATIVHSRIMCQRSPRDAFDATIDSRGRVYPQNVPNCDMRMEHQVLTELLWMASDTRNRTVPALFSADGRRMDIDFTNSSALRASIEQATIRQ